MNDYLLLKFAHLLAFVYWLGGDLGTFLASRHVISREASPEARAVALKIMLACDMGPKTAMPLIFPLGLHMAAMVGMVNLPGIALTAVWLLALYWFGVVLVLYLNEGKPFTAGLAQADFYFRIAVVLALLAYGASGLAAASMPAWLAWKILVFACLVACGIAIRINLKPFIPAFGQMMASGPSESSDSAMELSVGRCRPFVWLIWAGLLLNAALGLHLLG
ncbi:MAG: hypothetical protein AAGI11_17060 [Pseudomonadota bacterium]